MQQALNLHLRGLSTNPNDLSASPEGALSRAKNISIDAEQTAEPARGFSVQSYNLPAATDRMRRMTEYQAVLIGHYGNTTVNNIGYYSDSSGWTTLASGIGHPDASKAKLRFGEANGNLYFSTNTGIQKMDAYNATPGMSGIPKALDGSGTTTNGTFLSSNSAVAYRVVWGFKDLNSNLLLGSPSQRIVVANSSNTAKDVSVTFTIPSSISRNHFYQVYRSAQVSPSTVEPNDELNLVYESNPSNSDITNGYITITDSTPDELRTGAALYTNPSQQGILKSNDPPPFCKDFCYFRNVAIYANLKGKQNRSITLVGAGGTSGISAGNTITIGSSTFTAANTEVIGSAQFKVSTSGTPSQNIADTAQSLCRVINRGNSAYYAYYISEYQDLPGKIYVEERNFGGNTFYLTSSAPSTAFQPQLPSSGNTIGSSNDVSPNGIAYSKVNQPEAVALTSRDFAGSKNAEILRVVPLSDLVLIFKEDGGIFKITGLTPDNFVITPVDVATNLVAADSIGVLGESAYALSDQGVVSVTATGVEVVSRPIEDKIQLLFGGALDEAKSLSFAIPYNVDRKYVLFVPGSGSSTTCEHAFVYNYFTKSWVERVRSATCGFVRNSENKMYLGNVSTANVSVERKSFTDADFFEEGFAVTITASSGKTITLSSISGINVGDLLQQSATVFSVITAINETTAQVTVEDTLTWSNGAATVYASIECVVEWVPQTGGNPGKLKQFQEALMIFKKARFFEASIGFKSEQSASLESVTVTGQPSGGFGRAPFGRGAWGGGLTPKPIRTLVPLEKQMCSQLTVRLTIRAARNNWKLQGISIPYNDVSTEVGR